MLLDREAILKADDLPAKTVAVPEWGGDVKLRTLTGAQRDAFEASIEKARKGGAIDIRGLKARLVALCLVGADGAALFSETDLEKLNGKSARALDRLFGVAQELNGLGNQAVDELLGESDGGPNAVSGSVSPSPLG